jgi:hypothetical protein
MKETKPKKKTPGPKPEILKIDGSWKSAIKKPHEVKRPVDGWPK